MNNDESQSKFSSSCWQRKKKNSTTMDEEHELLNMDRQQELEISVKTNKDIKKDQSFTSILSSQSEHNVDSALLKSKYINNHIYIQDANNLTLNTQGSEYMIYTFDRDENGTITDEKEQFRNLPKFMSLLWKLKNPKIIIPIITGATNFKNWKNRKLEDQFKRGIIKTASKTECWFVTNGVNGGISQMVGDALTEELSNRSAERSKKAGSHSESEFDLKPLVLIGIVDSSRLNDFKSQYDGENGFIKIVGNKQSGKTFSFDLNADHTHFIIYNDEKNSLDEKMTYSSFRDRSELLFTKSLSRWKRSSSEKNKLSRMTSINSGDTSDDDMETANPKVQNRQIPIVSLAIRGDLNSIDAIEYKIKKEIPVVVLKGSGGAAEIIAFAFEEISENKDPDYEESYLRPEISKKLNDEFKDEFLNKELLRNTYRDKILTIVKRASKGTQKFLTIVDMKGLTFDFQDLDKYILTALLQSQTQLSGKCGKAQLDRNLRLTLDWNREDLALSEIFQRDDFKIIEIKHGIFENAILRLDREQFVELFLDQGFCIHRYLGRNNLRDLFEKTEKRDFFVQVILQGMLGHFTTVLPEDFFPEGLNLVLRKLTSISNMFSIMEIYMNQIGLYVTDARQAEKKALNFLTIYAVLMNRHKLAKILWKRSEDPIPVALVCALVYKNLLPYCQENYVRSQIEKNQQDFAECAVGVLDASFKENDPRSYSVLQEKYTDWNDSTALELAYNSKNRNFIAHPCCQKMLTKRLFGHIQVREYNTDFLIHLPSWVKVSMSAFFIFPMYFWIIFPVEEKRLNSSDEVDDDEEYDKDEEKEEEEMTKKELNRKYKTKNQTSNESRKKKQNDSKKEGENTQVKERNIKTSQFYSQPIYKKIYFLWTSPYTKFWINFLSYIVFLVLFGIVTLWPACGNLFLDSILWVWAATITFEDTRVAFHKYFTGSKLPLGSQIIEFILMVLFLLVFLIVRVVGTWSRFYVDTLGFEIDRIYFSKVFLAVFLLYYYYRTVFIFLPISHKLGPMLVRMKLMIKHDFTTYLRLFLIFMTAGAIALNAVLYPYYQFNWELMKRVILYRGFMTLFASDKQDLERITDACKSTNLSSKSNKSYKCVDFVDNSYFMYNSSKLREYNISGECNYQSTVAWMILIQYFLLVKLFLPSLLTAMFSATGQRISAQSEQLWMFQRYEIVLDYEIRSTFPPPFTLFCYIFMLFEWLCHFYKCCWKKAEIHCRKCCKKKQDKDAKPQSCEKQEKRLINVQHYWRNFAQSYAKESEKEDKEKQKQKFLETSLNKVREDLTSQKKSVQRLNDRVISLEKSFIQTQSYLETIKNLLTQKTSKSTLLDRQKSNYIHILSRESPYITTNISRCFVSEKYVPWECAHDLYDPQFLSISHEVLKVEKIFVDDEPNPKLAENLAAPPVNREVKIHFDIGLPNDTVPLSSNDVTKSGGSQLSLSQAKQNTFLWNAVKNIDLPDGRTIIVDRKSWIFKVEERTPMFYSLDQLGLPRNPMGRTGIRGRGALYRYGPNHEIMAIVTRPKKNKNKIIYVDRKKLLEFIACKDLTSQMKIPGDKVVGDESKFSVVCRTFIELVFEESSVERGANFTEKDMTTFFASFASNKPISWDSNISNELLTSQFNDLGFFASMIYSGYIDDPRNTDNAWVEAEIWNFHYDKEEFIDKRIKNPTGKWREVSSNVRIHSNDIIVDVLKEVAEKHNAFYN